MSTMLSLPSSPLQSAVSGVKSLLQEFRDVVVLLCASATATDTSDVWRLYRVAGETDSVSAKAAEALAQRDCAQ